MSQITQAGRLLDKRLNRYIGTSLESLQLCSLIARHAKTYQRWVEVECNGEYWNGQYNRCISRALNGGLDFTAADEMRARALSDAEKQIERLQRLISSKVAQLPCPSNEEHPRGNSWVVDFSGVNVWLRPSWQPESRTGIPVR